MIAGEAVGTFDQVAHHHSRQPGYQSHTGKPASTESEHDDQLTPCGGTL